MHLVGNYGVGIHFSDGHTTGIYRFAHLKRPKSASPAPAGRAASPKGDAK